MEFITIHTRPLLPPKDDIFEIFNDYIFDIKDGDIIFITSKIISIHQGRCIPVGSIAKEELIKQESDTRITSDLIPGRNFYITLTDNILIASAWIDESNANGHYILRPENMKDISQEIHTYFCKKYNIKNLWIIITDSAIKIWKLWVVWIAIYSYWILPLNDNRGEKDIFWKELKITQINVVDWLSAIAVYLMWEGNQCTPIIIWRNIPDINYTQEDIFNSIVLEPEKDLYKPLLKPLIDKRAYRKAV